MAESEQQLVLAFFDSAVADLEQWDKATDEIKLVRIGILAKDEHGKIRRDR